MALSCCKKLSILLWGITSKHDGDFYCLNSFHSYTTKKKSLMRYVQIMIIVFRNVWEIQKILKYNHGEKSMKFPCVIYADLECLLEKMSPYLNNHDLESLLKEWFYIKMTLTNLIPKKNTSIHPLVVHCLHNVHLIQQKISLNGV